MDGMPARAQCDSALLAKDGMDAIRIDDRIVVDIEFRPIIGRQFELVFSGRCDPELSVIVDAKPVDSARDSGDAGRLGNVLIGHVQ